MGHLVCVGWWWFRHILVFRFSLEQHHQVFLVAGGMFPRNHTISSTEMLTRTSSAWVTVKNLPRKIKGLRGITLGGVLYMIG